MRHFACDCGNRLFFENTQCLACKREVGWCPNCWTMVAMDAQEHAYRCARCGCGLEKCANWTDYEVCNRNLTLPDEGDATGGRLCDCCRYNETIPDLSVPGNLEHWRLLEQAKRRLIYGLDTVGLPHGATADGFRPGLSFDFKGDAIAPKRLWRTVGDDERVYTGHVGGKITINIREADDVEREKLRVDLGEAHRTLIGHFRHEIGHYYWDVIVENNPTLLGGFAALFGDPEHPSYGDALDRHYAEGPPEDWQDHFISAYASMHPWEDWAETFAFYFNIVDVMEAVSATGLMAVHTPDDLDDILEIYVRLGILLNELNRGMGLVDFLPALVVENVVEKLRFVHKCVTGAAVNASPFPAFHAAEDPR